MTNEDIKLKTYSFYDDFPENRPEEGKPYINCYMGDFCVRYPVEKNAIAILLEPRSLEPYGYDYIEKHPEQFKHVFTYDSQLLRKVPQAHFLLWATLWCTSDVPKTKGISMISSDKTCCELHKARLELAKILDKNDKVDCFGTFKGPEHYVNTYDAHAEYKFAIAFENYIDDMWYTEKILNCFGTKTVPIYYGARRIGDVFNADGIIQVDDWRKIPDLVNSLDIDAEYEKRKAAIEDNFERVKPYGARWRDRFFNEYGHLLRGMMNDINNR